MSEKQKVNFCINKLFIQCNAGSFCMHVTGGVKSGIITTAIAVASPVGRPFNIFVVTLTVVQYGVWSCHKL